MSLWSPGPNDFPTQLPAPGPSRCREGSPSVHCSSPRKFCSQRGLSGTVAAGPSRTILFFPFTERQRLSYFPSLFQWLIQAQALPGGQSLHQVTSAPHLSLSIPSGAPGPPGQPGPAWASIVRLLRGAVLPYPASWAQPPALSYLGSPLEFGWSCTRKDAEEVIIDTPVSGLHLVACNTKCDP